MLPESVRVRLHSARTEWVLLRMSNWLSTNRTGIFYRCQPPAHVRRTSGFLRVYGFHRYVANDACRDVKYSNIKYVSRSSIQHGTGRFIRYVWDDNILSRFISPI